MEKHNMIFQYLSLLTANEEDKVLFVLLLIAIAMIVDFVTGTIAAIVREDREFRSKKGINGILRKIASMLLLIFFLPCSMLIPEGMGIALVYTMYIGYLIMEIKSIVENVGKNGTDVTLFQEFIKRLSGGK
ncbi:phage holin family protein [Peptostreptococcus equinus]|uniref:Phage holin family protein n=1 Tax=Peptostreptococcus equinus TaxID=3003601 RepID=A0ABY7JNR6_9FIRM|nr:phage holin family protein [Peptostreptococcus sp. CBA3647]WAW14735.1 phage holin family protein [Peptostreptococcus sp. CBA3647]